MALFNYQPMVRRYPAVQAQWDRLQAMWPQLFAGGITVQKIHELRPANQNVDSTPQESADKCSTTEISFDGTAFGSENPNLRIFVHTPLGPKKKRRAQLWFHGGGFVFSSAASYQKSCCRRAVMNAAVVFNVDIGVAPETKAPHWFLNGYAALKYALQEAERFCIDTSRVAISGESSGGYTTVGVAMELAKRDEAHLAKLVVPDIGAFNNDFLTVQEQEPGEIGELYAAVKDLHMECMAHLCTEPQRQFKNADPNIFPAQMSDELIRKLPDVFLMTREFDQFGRGNEMFAERLQKHGKLLELYIQPGTGHALTTPEAEQQFWKDEALVFSTFA